MIDHGTRRGYQQHTARGHRGVEICDECAQANRDYMRVYMAARYDPARRRAVYLKQKAAGYYARQP